MVSMRISGDGQCRHQGRGRSACQGWYWTISAGLMFWSITPPFARMARFLDVSDDEWQQVMDVDLNAAIWLSRA